ncbi:MAG: multi-copper polyphenol oxidoreductase laccase, partial [Spartobacteria bacterium]|nr:multi-copper polyphenol oxidoreductase laccase [Spartobacteria bacterium]
MKPAVESIQRGARNRTHFVNRERQTPFQVRAAKSKLPRKFSRVGHLRGETLSVGTEQLPFEQFPELSAANACRHLFTRRIPGIDVSHDKAEALSRLDAAHAEIRAANGLDNQPLITAEQIHGAEIMVVDPVTAIQHFDGCDGLITRHSGIVLGIHVADCCAVYIVDPKTSAIGLVHSGRRGTERNIAGNAIRQK